MLPKKDLAASHSDDLKENYAKACERAFTKARFLIKGGSTWGEHIKVDSKGMPESASDPLLCGFKSVMVLKEKPIEIVPDPETILKKQQ
jgi:hypothetical protein